MKCPRCQFENPADSRFCNKCGTQILSPQGPVSFTQTVTIQTPLKELTVGTTFAERYQVIEELGKGGMGRVYKAFDTEIKETVALKLLNPEIASDENVIERFRNELKLARKISHRNVCRMYDLGRVENTTYITMEYVSGEDLKTLLRRIGQFTAKRAIIVSEQVAEGLAEAHRLGVIHRDLKPQNIMIDRDGNARIMDFGIARSLKGLGITDTGVIIGTPDYMSPEQLEGQEADRRSDIYALGVILYEMVTGEPPFEGETPLILAMKHKTEKARDPRERNAHIPEEMSRLILRCLEKDRERRYQSADEILKDLKAIAKQIPSTRDVTAEIPKVVRPRRKILWTVGAVLIFLMAAAAVGYLFFKRGSKEQPVGTVRTAAGKYKSSIAVLPFEDLSPQKDQESLCNGITEDLITKLASIGQLKVISRTSAMRYKNVEKDVRLIGKELDVATILEGSIQKEKDNIRINVQLVNVEDGSHLLAESYDRKLQSLFTIQDEISKAIVNALRIELVAGQEYMLVKRYTQNPDAYNLYLEGRLNWNKRTEASLKKSIDLYQEAIIKDPKFALAYAGIADTYNILADLTLLRPTEAFPKAKEAAEKALEIDEALAEGYISRAFVKFMYDWDWMGAEIDFSWAIGLNPSYATAYQWYGNLLIDLGRFDEALAKLEKAKELDPRSLSINTDLADLFYSSRRYDEAIKQAKNALALDPNYHSAHRILGLAYLEKRSFKKALQEFEKADKLSGGKGLYLMHIAYAQAAAGHREEAQRSLEELIKRSEQSYVPATDLTLISAALGDKDRAFEYLDKAYEEKADTLVSTKVDPRFDPLRDDPRFEAILEKMRLK
jgi:TolB-like protein/tRNA A-37 threonylcarbamoyl transferase component Bud32/Flp pilus assembly protein TadD